MDTVARPTHLVIRKTSTPRDWRLACKLAHQHLPAGMELEDACQEAYLEIERIRPRYDPAKGASWPHYASLWVRHRLDVLAGVRRKATAHASGRFTGFVRIDEHDEPTLPARPTDPSVQVDFARLRASLEMLPEIDQEILVSFMTNESQLELVKRTGRGLAWLEMRRRDIFRWLRARLERST